MTKEEAPEQIDCGKQCPCQFGDAVCAFPDCYSKDELVNVIEKKNGFITQLQAQVGELQHALDCMTTTAGELQDMWNHLDAASKASEKLHQIAIAGKEEVIRVLNKRVEEGRT